MLMNSIEGILSDHLMKMENCVLLLIEAIKQKKNIIKELCESDIRLKRLQRQKKRNLQLIKKQQQQNNTTSNSFSYPNATQFMAIQQSTDLPVYDGYTPIQQSSDLPVYDAIRDAYQIQEI